MVSLSRFYYTWWLHYNIIIKVHLLCLHRIEKITKRNTKKQHFIINFSQNIFFLPTHSQCYLAIHSSYCMNHTEQLLSKGTKTYLSIVIGYLWQWSPGWLHHFFIVPCQCFPYKQQRLLQYSWTGTLQLPCKQQLRSQEKANWPDPLLPKQRVR